VRSRLCTPTLSRRSTGPTPRVHLKALLAICLGISTLAQPSIASGQASDAPAPPARPLAPPPTHRSLRDNVPREIPEATEPTDFSGYPSAPPFSVVPQIDTLTFYPCSTCHNVLRPNPVPRKLNTPHPAALKHGAGRFWCLQCHQEKDRDNLHTLSGQSVSFNDAYLVCGQCHFNRQKDWYFGAHGKRVVNWQGERIIYNCTHCHDPHDPAVKPRAPSKAPPVRVGLKPMPRSPEAEAPAAIYLQTNGQGQQP